MKPNEIIGFAATLGGFITFFVGLARGFSIWTLIGIGAFGMVQFAFLSLWGLWTFNPWWRKVMNY